MKTLVYSILGGLVGVLLGFFVPFVLCWILTSISADPSLASAFSLLPLFLMPLGAFVGGVVGGCLSPDNEIHY